MKTNSSKREPPIPDSTLFGDGAMEETGGMDRSRPSRPPVSPEESKTKQLPGMEGDRLGESRKVLDIGDIASLFHCSREKIKRMARRGELPAFKFGKSWYVLQDDLERFLSNQVESSRHLRRIQEVSP